MGFRAEGWLLIMAALVAIGLVAASTLWVPEPPRQMALPTASDLVEMERYLTPVATDETRIGVPPRVAVDGSPFGVPRAADPTQGQRPAAAPAPRWTVTAIMIAGERRIAIVNDRMVRPGDRLADGARIEAVERDHVVLITPSGQRRRLELEG